ncbi:hypothetical protein KSS87_018713 [Heliosperma pusillum]|nr:hypothetical protein KSS87_018713 [Heliosperma pusillum]
MENHSTVSSKQPSDVTTRFNIRKPPRNTKVQYISPEEAMALESGAQKNLSSTGKSNLSSPGKSNLSCRPTVNRIFASKTEASRCTTIPPKLSAKHNPHEGPPGFTNLLSTRSLPNTLLDKKLSASKDTEKCVVPKQRNRQDSPSVISLSAKKARTTNVNAEEKNKEPPRRTYANKDTSAGMTVHLEKSLSSNAELTSPTNVRCKVQALDHASGQSVEHLPTVSSDKEPPRRPYANKDTSSGMTVHLEKSPKSNVELGSPTNVRCKAQASEHASGQLVEYLPTVSSDKEPPRRPYVNKVTSAGMTVHLEKIPKSNAELGRPTNVRCKSQAVENLEHASVQSVEHLPTVSSGVGVCVDAQIENFGSDGKTPLRVALDLDKYLLNHPAEIPTWKGRINITHTEDILHCRSFDGIQAHPPCKVHRKVYDLSKQLPGALQVELLPRLSFWLNLFEDGAPGALDIGLYFLSPKGSEQNLTSLVGFLDEHDMLLRSEIDGVELLFISSRHLPKDSQTASFSTSDMGSSIVHMLISEKSLGFTAGINRTFFLWGLFRSAEKAIIAGSAEKAIIAESAEIAIIAESAEKAIIAESAEIVIIAESAEKAIIAESAEKAMILESGEESGEDMDMDIDMSGGHEVGIIDKVIAKPAEKPEEEPTVVKVIPFEKDCRDGASPLPTSVTSYLEKQLDFEGDLERCLDRFIMLN